MTVGITRRGAVGMGLATALAGRSLAVMSNDHPRFVVGTYRAEGGGGSYPLAHDAAADRWRVGTPLPGIENMSFSAYSARHRLYYGLDERAEGTIAAYRPDWVQVGMKVAVGADPCHVAIDRRQTRLAIADYGSGDIVIVAIDPATGVPGGSPIVRAHRGSGPNAERQRGPHAHWVGFSPDGRWLHSVDLGADAVWRHDLSGGIGEARPAYRAPPGSGPRHLAYHPRLPKAYLLSELISQVTVLDGIGDGRFHASQTVVTIPPDVTTANYPAELAIDRAGDRLYVSNRGHDSITVFAIAADGRLRPIQHIPTGGRWPRHFLLIEDRRRLLVANERSGTVQPFAILPDGRLARAGDPVTVPGAAFITRI